LQGNIIKMIQRLVKSRIEKLTKHFPVVAILGPRQIGKTTLAKSIIQSIDKKVIYLDLELPADLNKLNNPQIFFEANQEHCIIIDEVQRKPDLFPVIRAVTDRHRVPGRFIILGSASPELLKQSSESLVGRIVYTELPGFLVQEIRDRYHVNDLWLRGGFPEPFLMNDPEIIQEWHNSFILTYIERDLPSLGLSAEPLILNRFLQMLAHNHGGLLNLANFARSLGISSPTVSKYANFFENAFLIRTLTPRYTNVKKRLVKSPKIYLRDSGLLHHLHGISDYNQLLGHPILGPSWEGFVIEQIISSLKPGISYSFYRTAEGAECDLILSKGVNIMACIEVKFSDSPKTTKSFTTAVQDLECDNNYIIIPDCPEPYPLREDVTVCDLEWFIQKQPIDKSGNKQNQAKV
jgi:uncharacterized protein